MKSIKFIEYIIIYPNINMHVQFFSRLSKVLLESLRVNALNSCE